jgi:RNase P subunit RPR2
MDVVHDIIGATYRLNCRDCKAIVQAIVHSIRTRSHKTRTGVIYMCLHNGKTPKYQIHHDRIGKCNELGVQVRPCKITIEVESLNCCGSALL